MNFPIEFKERMKNILKGEYEDFEKSFSSSRVKQFVFFIYIFS